MKIFHILPVLFFVSRMKISPGPVNKIPNIGKKKPIATQIRYSWMIADMMKADRRANNGCFEYKYSANKSFSKDK
jgi:hypothetical protein